MVRSCRSFLVSAASLLLLAGCGAEVESPVVIRPAPDPALSVRLVDARKVAEATVAAAPKAPVEACPVYETKAGAPAKLADSSFTTGFGRCGELPFVLNGGVRVALPDGRIVTLEKDASGSSTITLSPDGTRLLTVKWGEWGDVESEASRDSYNLYDLATLTRIGSGTMPFRTITTTSEAERGNGRFLPGEGSPFVVCIDGHLGVLGAEGFEKWGQSEADCESLVHAPNHPVVAYSGKGGMLHVADFSTGKVQQAPIEYMHRFKGREDSRVDFLSFSPDGRILLHQSAILSATDYGVHPEPESSILDATTGEVLASLPFNATPRALTDRRYEDRRPFFADEGHLLVIPEDGGSIVLTDDLSIVELKGLVPVAAFGGKLLAEAESGLVLMGLDGSERSTLVEGATVVSVDRNRAGTRLVVEYDTGECFEWQEATERVEAFCR
ncbi:MAG TPA: hypothetical protein VGD74_00715, partial [Vulgatibacter sp.]